MRYNVLLLISFFTCVIFLSCNTSRYGEESATKGTVTNDVNTPNDTLSDANSSKNFDDMTVEEKWRSLTPARRNSLRQNPNLYPYFQTMIAAEPDLEEEGPREQEHLQGWDDKIYTDPPQNVDYEALWNSFSEERKQYMRQHPANYPNFQPYF